MKVTAVEKTTTAGGCNSNTNMGTIMNNMINIIMTNSNIITSSSRLITREKSATSILTMKKRMYLSSHKFNIHKINRFMPQIQTLSLLRATMNNSKISLCSRSSSKQEILVGQSLTTAILPKNNITTCTKLRCH